METSLRKGPPLHFRHRSHNLWRASFPPNSATKVTCVVHHHHLPPSPTPRFHISEHARTHSRHIAKKTLDLGLIRTPNTNPLLHFIAVTNFFELRFKISLPQRFNPKTSSMFPYFRLDRSFSPSNQHRVKNLLYVRLQQKDESLIGMVTLLYYLLQERFQGLDCFLAGTFIYFKNILYYFRN